MFAKLKPLPDCMLGCSKPFSTWGITTKPACVVPAMLDKNASILVHELVRLNVLSVAAGCLSNPPLLPDSRRFAQHLVLTGEHTSCRVGEADREDDDRWGQYPIAGISCTKASSVSCLTRKSATSAREM